MQSAGIFPLPKKQPTPSVDRPLSNRFNGLPHEPFNRLLLLFQLFLTDCLTDTPTDGL
jgi:hypothetical protein